MARPFAAAVAALFFADSVFAADLVNYSAPSAPSPCDWTGFYLGVSGGFGFNPDDPSYSYRNVSAVMCSPASQRPTHLDADGGHGRSTIGFNDQSRSLVLGIEGDISGTDFGENPDHHVAGGRA